MASESIAPNRRKFTRHGDVRRWLDNVALTFERNECLAFPFSKDRHGYGRINISGKYIGAHVYVAERVLPTRPSSTHEVCHTCANGSGGCVAPLHLTWGTRRENVNDAIRDGTFSPPPHPSGEQHPRARFSDEQIAYALRLVDAGQTITAAAKAIGMSLAHLSQIRKGWYRK